MRTRLLAALVGACVTATALAQVRVDVPFTRGAPRSSVIRAVVSTVNAAVRPGGQGHIRVELHNPDGEPHRVEAELFGLYLQSFRATAVVELGPRESERLFLPLPAVTGQARLQLSADSADPVHAVMVTRPGNQIGVSLLLVLGTGADAAGWTAMLERRIRGAPAASTPFGDPRQLASTSIVQPADLPPDWGEISGFDLVVVDGRAPGLDDAAQRTLRGYLRAGGRLLVVAADAMPSGVLGDALAGGPIARGFGMALALDAEDTAAFPAGPLRGDVERRLVEWLSRSDGFLQAGARPTSGPLPPESYRPLAIPGLGEAPLRVFFLLILVFAVVVGPVNYLYWRRRRRLPMLLLTVPALGLVTTLVLLGYGFLSEGLGVRAAERSLTVLDQIGREGVAWSARTLYAGLSPDRLVPRAGTLVCALEPFANRWSESESSLEIRPDGSIDGALVPSRMSTTLAAVSQSTERARLRFERADDGTLAVLAGPELAPVRGAGAVVLRTPEGGYWIARADGRLESCGARDAQAAVFEVVDRYLQAAGPVSHRSSRLPLGESWANEGPTARFLKLASSGEGALPPGHCVALVEDSPLVDRMEVDGERTGVHVLLARIGPEDLVD